jgi:cysteinyl-tRNA synthetase
MAERVWRQPHAAALAAAAAAAPAAPAGAPPPPPPDTLVLYNSLVDRKVPFVPSGGPASRAVTWYACGPTVYDSAHVGHARNYVTFDIVRRVLEDYFGYAIFYVMNVTDVDDKIIARARRGHLLAEYEKEAGGDAGRVAADAAAALAAARAAQAAKLAAAAAAAAEAGAEAAAGDAGAARRREGLAEGEAAEALLLAQLDAAAAALDAAAAAADVPALLALAGDALAAHLDATRGAAVTDPEVFRAHAARYEAAFLEDMDALGVRPPTVLTRVSEYVPEIVEYVEKILENGMGYATEGGSVYFDTAAFRAAGHTYGKLAPWAVGSAALAQESGGAAAAAAGGKRAAADFALWKAAKPGEPAWPSPWGAGRPGWHIECSAMASALVGATLDIHSGGEDLRFPHHDNELAQAEARFHCAGCDQWVNYFLHSGHLGVEGLKMSKSLKNFVTIRCVAAGGG